MAESDGFTCQICGRKTRDHTPESNFIGWTGHCVECEIEGRADEDRDG